MTDHHDHHDHFDHGHIPPSVQADINAGKALFEEALEEAPRDEHYERILETLEDVVVKIDEEKKNLDRYQFNHAEFVEACEHVVQDQLSALRKDKLTIAEFSTRFNRWFVFCDGVINLGISCLYSQDALKDKDYETVFKTLKLNKVFESTFLKPRRIRIEMRHKSKQVMEKYPWLSMPVMIIKDAEGTEHQIAITPSPNATVWWLDILASFHGSYNWVLTEPYDPEEDEEMQTTTVADFNATRHETVDTSVPVEAPKDYVVHQNNDLLEALRRATKAAEPVIKKQSWWMRLKNWFLNLIPG